MPTIARIVTIASFAAALAGCQSTQGSPEGVWTSTMVKLADIPNLKKNAMVLMGGKYKSTWTHDDGKAEHRNGMYVIMASKGIIRIHPANGREPFDLNYTVKGDKLVIKNATGEIHYSRVK